MSTSDPSKTVFISYRRSVSSYLARAIFMDLRDHGYDVFMDVESIDSGTFDTIILNQIAARAHFLILCTPGTFENCDRPGDWLCREVETAMDRQRNIVPIMANGFKFEDNRRFMTGGLNGLPRLNALPLYHEYFDAGMEQLRNRCLKQPVAGAVLPAPPTDLPVVAEKIKVVASQPAPTPKQLTAEEFLDHANMRSEADLDGRIADYSEAIRLNPTFAMAYYNRGTARYFHGDLDAAIADFNEAIRLDPNDAESYNNRGLACADQGDLDRAIADFTRSIKLKNPEPHFAYDNRGSARYARGDLDGAIADHTEAIRINPAFASAYCNRGNARGKKDDLDGAITDYGMAIQLSPGNAQYYYNRALVYGKCGRAAETISDYSQYLRLTSTEDKYSTHARERIKALGGVPPR